MKRLMFVAILASTLVGCSTAQPVRTAEAPLPSPTPAVTKDQTVAAQGKLDAPMTIDIPAWYIKAPASTEDYVYISGTGFSSDLSMSQQKALLDAQVKLADKINGVVNALMKQHKTDNGGSVGTDKTSLTVKKLIADTAITGYHIEDSRVVSENRSYRSFVLIRYPMGDANRLLKDKRQQESQAQSRDEDAQDELEREIQSRKKPVSQVAPVRAPAAIPSTPVSAAPANSVPLADGSEIKLMEVDNAEYRARREAALQKDGAFISQTTVR